MPHLELLPAADSPAIRSRSRVHFLYILRAHRIAIHLRTIERRQVGICYDIRGQHPPQDLFDRHTLCPAAPSFAA